MLYNAGGFRDRELLMAKIVSFLAAVPPFHTGNR